MNKLTLNFVKEQIEKEGYALLSKEYKGSKTKLEVRCTKGHEYEVKWNTFQQGKRCLICSGKQKHTFEYVKERIEKEGYEILSKEYINAHIKLKVKCPEGHEYKITWANFQQGKRCPYCFGNKKLTYEFVKERIEKEGYILISKEYVNSKIKLKIRCQFKHEYEVKWNDFKNGSRCLICYRKNNKGKNHPLWKGGYSSNNIPKYNTYAHQIEYAEEVRRNKEDNNILEVKCAYCGKWYIPKMIEVQNRISFLNGKGTGENRLYCSQECKQECPIFNQIKYPRGFKKATSREVQPELRQLVFYRDKYTCQKCGKHKDELKVGLHCHHIIGVEQNPLESADMDNCTTFCKDCHKRIHKQKGCTYVDMRCK